ncbi:MAG: hypothetical protein ABFC89_11440, partial [Methanospirillum sp.]
MRGETPATRPAGTPAPTGAIAVRGVPLGVELPLPADRVPMNEPGLPTAYRFPETTVGCVERGVTVPSAGIGCTVTGESVSIGWTWAGACTGGGAATDIVVVGAMTGS